MRNAYWRIQKKLARWALIVVTIIMVVVALAEASEPPEIDIAAAVRHLAEREADEAEPQPEDCIDEAGIDVACLQALWFGIDLTHLKGTEDDVE